MGCKGHGVTIEPSSLWGGTTQFQGHRFRLGARALFPEEAGDPKGRVGSGRRGRLGRSSYEGPEETRAPSSSRPTVDPYLTRPAFGGLGDGEIQVESEPVDGQ